MKKLVFLIGRVLLSVIFVSSAVSKLFSWNDTVQYTTSSYSQWISGTSVPEAIHQGMVALCPHVVLMLIIATLFEGIGGLLLLFGFKIRFGAFLLILFIIPVTIIMHPFWLSGGQEKMIQTAMFMKNISILGGLLILASKGGESEA